MTHELPRPPAVDPRAAALSGAMSGALGKPPAARQPALL